MQSINYKKTINTGVSIISFLLVTTIFSFNIFNHRFTPYIVLLIQLALIYISLFITKIKIQRNKQIIFFVYILFILSIFSSFFSSKYQLLSLQRTFLVFIPSILLYILTINDPYPLKTNRSMCILFSYIGLFLSLSGIIIYIFGNYTYTELGRMQIINFGPIELYQVVQGVSPYFRYSSLTDNPNTLGSIFIFTIPMTIYAIYSKYLSTSKGIIFMTLQLISLYMTRSRTSIITIVLLFIFYYIFFSERNKTLKKISMIIVPIISLFFILRFKTSLLLALRLSSLDTSGRIDAWKIGLSYIINRPLIGVGFGVSQEELLEPLGYNITFHNIYITLLTEIGIVGFIIILYIWINTIIKGLIYINKLENCEKLRMSLIISVLILFVLLAHQFFEVQILRYGIHTFYWIYLLGYINNEYIKS